MRTHLKEASLPLELRVDAVLPGVHSALDGIKATVEDGLSSVRRSIGEVKEGLEGLSIEQEQGKRELAQVLVDYASTLVGGRAQLPFNLSPSPQDDTQDDGVESLPEEEGEENPYLVYTMCAKHKSLVDLIDEWYGDGAFDDGSGGIKGRDEQFGTKWRSHINKQLYSRSKRVVTTLHDIANLENKRVKEVALEYNDLFVQKKCSVSNLVVEFQRRGLLRKKGARGKHKTNI